MNVFSFVAAASNSGKTTLIEKIVPLLKAKDIRVAVIKHASKGFEVHPEICRYLDSGAETVIFSGAGELAVIRNTAHHLTLENMQKDIGEADITIYEGFKEDARNKIEVFRFDVSGKRPLCMDDPSYIALVSDVKFDIPIPQFDLNDADGVAAFIME
jgi:molybdopterin-guanine dinucleotide biosynthesis protein B